MRIFSAAKKRILVLSLVAAFVSGAIMVSCQQKASPQPQGGAPVAANNWASQMHRLSDVIARLIPFVSSSKEFNDPKNFSTISSAVEELSQLGHKVSDKDVRPDQDPSLNFISVQFEEEIQRASDALKMGHRDYARHLLRNSTSFCIQCHTRNNMGPSFSQGRIDTVVEALPPMDRGEYYAATRQFDKAYESLLSVLRAPAGKQTNMLTWDRAARYALAIAVRFQNDPGRAQEIGELVMQSPQAPTFLREDAKHWLKAIKEWKRESKGAKMTTFDFAKALISSAQKVQRYTTDHGADVYYLRATGILHNILAKGIVGSKKSEVLYHMGLSYDALRDLNFWTLHEQYYEACIRNTPHTKVAFDCFKKYEESVFFGFSGSAGYALPADIQLKLAELRALALNQEKK